MTIFGPHEDIAAIAMLASRGGALCTLVNVEGGYSRGIGSHLAINDQLGIRGTLADDCLEAELVSQARLAGEQGTPRLLRFGAGSPFVDFRLPCGAGIDVLIDPSFPKAAAAGVLAQLENRRPASLRLGDGWVGQFQPELRLIVLGTQIEASALEQVAEGLGIEMDVRLPGDRIALGQAPQSLEADAFTAIISLFHDHEWERDVLPWALATDSFYIGAIGGAETRRRRLEMLKAQGFDQQALDRIRSPIGMIPAAKDPVTLAVSILAEVLVEYRACLGAKGECVFRERDLVE